ncbi:hypothetical protein GOP47_0010941 [Adiantum capillus-veneris]|uniref:non-specific serine/threonine protein kinase n=1 Tax=Adiantum capillus-veneris TaxID=13818 RepID=A0A9D4UW31_ADICA|nr:hypothetical protein GOP47_0010478 [Adiantum capillus-veneris]KAI5074980.1 hypothetical protein GOP47_0010941 [Adiantum capillus-veneris]
MSFPAEAPSGDAGAPSPLSDIVPDPLLTSPAPSAVLELDSPPAPLPSSRDSPPPPASSRSPPSLSSPPPPASGTSPDSASAPSPNSSTAGRSPPPPSSKTTHSPPPPPLQSNSSRSSSPPPPRSPPPPSGTFHSPPPPSAHYSPPPPTSKSSLSSANTPSPSPPSSSSSTISGGSLVGIGIAGVLAFLVLSVLFYCLCRRKKRYYPGDYYHPHGGPSQKFKDPYYGVDMRHQQEWCSPSSDALIKMPPATGPLPPSNGYDPIPPPPKGGSPGLGNSKAWFTYQDLATATGGFAEANALGEGGFGRVYKGTLSSGQLVAVKQLKVGASQGEKEFRAEVEIISRVHHRHLVSLVGYCIADRQRLLVYDYVPNGTLEYHLHKKNDGPIMDWPTRLKIACGAARGLAYLHEDCHPRIIHRDIKSSNILLDDNFDAQVSDFGLAKLTSDTNTHVTTRVMGTFGYLAPEYASSGKLTDKSDVFSFGVVLLELLTGRKPVDPSQPPGEESLVEWARPVLAQVTGEEDLLAIADPTMEGNFDPRELMRMLEAAAACVRHSSNKRPRMGQVVRALEDDSSLSDLNKGFKPGQSGVFGSFANTEYENGSYSADMRKYMRVALDNTQEFGSECSGATSDYGLNGSISSGEYRMSREMADRGASREMMVDRGASREMVARSVSQQQRPPKPMSMKANILTYNTQDFRLGS